ncbi:MAG: hypothetical protein BWK73_31130, partial [Thiothrix lacustris]
DELMKRFLERDGAGSGGQPFDFDSKSRGSGFIYSADGYIVTNHHVVLGATDIKVALNDGRELPAQLIGSDERTDVAVLKVTANDLPVLKMGASEKLEVGEWVLAIGSPFGFDHSATAGIVSGKDAACRMRITCRLSKLTWRLTPAIQGGRCSIWRVKWSVSIHRFTAVPVASWAFRLRFRWILRKMSLSN